MRSAATKTSALLESVGEQTGDGVSWFMTLSSACKYVADTNGFGTRRADDVAHSPKVSVGSQSSYRARAIDRTG